MLTWEMAKFWVLTKNNTANKKFLAALKLTNESQRRRRPKTCQNVPSPSKLEGRTLGFGSLLHVGLTAANLQTSPHFKHIIRLTFRKRNRRGKMLPSSWPGSVVFCLLPNFQKIYVAPSFWRISGSPFFPDKVASE